VAQKEPGCRIGFFCTSLYTNAATIRARKEGKRVAEDKPIKIALIGATDYEYSSVKPYVGGKERGG
jgi:hypothetical protein